VRPIADLRRMWFAARRLRLPISPEAVVLEVGSGDSPCPRSDVLFDMTLESFERVGGRTVVDRPIVLGLGEHLPFRDKAFDYVIAFHVLEHSANPAGFLREMERIASAGYIETPVSWIERVKPLTMHRTEVGLEPSSEGARLVIRHKSSPIPDPDLSNEFNRSVATFKWLERIQPDALVTRFFWRDKIRYRIVNPETPVDWPSPPEAFKEGDTDSRPMLRRFLKRCAQLSHRPKAVNLLSLMRCTDCDHAPLQGSLRDAYLCCPLCARRYALVSGIPYMHPLGWKSQRP
jgi:SAM-dependent methyltransferase